MIRPRLLALCAAAAASAQDPAPAPPVPPPAPPVVALQLQQDLVGIARRVMPSVVTVRSFVRVATDGGAAPAGKPPFEADPAAGWITAERAENDYPGFAPLGSGSGFFIGREGDVMTALQPLLVAPDVIADVIEVETGDGHRALTEVVGYEPTLQFAILRCTVFESWERPSMRPLVFGPSEELEVGSLLIGCGDPFGPERFLATGMLVAKPSRDCYQELMSASYMQATMAVHPGAYGGPLVDLEGRVVGILSRLEVEGQRSLVSAGSAWALPSKILTGLYDSIVAAGTTRSPWLGFSVMSRAEIATTRGLSAFQKMQKPPHGILLENVFAPSPAAAAGLLPDDFLTDFEGVEIHAPVEFQRQLYLAGVGRVVKLRFFRKGEVFERELTIDARPPEARPK